MSPGLVFTDFVCLLCLCQSWSKGRLQNSLVLYGIHNDLLEYVLQRSGNHLYFDIERSQKKLILPYS